MAASAFLYNTDDDRDDHHNDKRLAVNENFFIFLTNEDNHKQDDTMPDQGIQERSVGELNGRREHSPRLAVSEETFQFLSNSETFTREEEVMTTEQQGNSDVQKRQIKPPNRNGMERNRRLAVNEEYFLFLPDLDTVESEEEEILNEEQGSSELQKRQTKPWWPPRRIDTGGTKKGKRQTKPIWNFRSDGSKRDSSLVGLNKRQRPPIRNPYAYRRSGIADIFGKRHLTLKKRVGNDHEKRELSQNIHNLYDNFNKRQKPPHTLGS